MFKNELKILLGNNPKGKGSRYLRLEYEDLKSYNDKLAKQIKVARRKKDIPALTKAFKEINRELEKELRNEVNGTVNVKFRNTTFELSKKKLSSLKNPEKYINKLYFNRTVKQIDKLIKKGKETEAIGLIKLTAKSLDKLGTDEKKVKEVKRKLNQLASGLGNEYGDIDMEEEEGKSYDVVATSSGSTLTLTVI